MSNTPSPSAAPDSPAAKPRNPVERIVVWLLIIALLAVCGKEALARFGYTNSLNSLQSALEADDDGNTLTIDEIQSHISGSPTREEDAANRVISYHWQGLLKKYGSIHLAYSDENEVLGLLTADAPQPEEPVFVTDGAPQEGDESTMDMAAAAGPDGEPGGDEGRRRRFDPMQFDTDADGKISLDEAPERMKAHFAEIDANGDGFADQEEFAALRSADGERPRRPEESAPAQAPAEEKAAPPTAEAGDKPVSSDAPAPESTADESTSAEQ